MLVARFSAACTDMGYLKAVVTGKQEATGKIFDVQPGAQYRVRTLSVTGNTRFTTDQLLEGAPRSGDVYSAGRMKQWVQGMEKKNSDAGAPAKVESSRLDFDDANQVVNLTVSLQETF